MKPKLTKLFSFLLTAGFCAAMVLLLTADVLAKYCPGCGTYNNDSNAYCVKCGFDFKTSHTKKTRVGVLFVSSVYPGDKARFTIYHKGTVTPFLVWNSRGDHEIGEVWLPVYEDVEFVAMQEDDIPSLSRMPELAGKYRVEKVITMDMNARKTDRVPIFSSQSYTVNFDVAVFDVKGITVINEKRYQDSFKSWPDVTTNQVRSLCNGLWEQMVPNLRTLLNFQ